MLLKIRNREKAKVKMEVAKLVIVRAPKLKRAPRDQTPLAQIK